MRLHLVRRTAAAVLLALICLTAGFYLVLRARLANDITVISQARLASARALVVVDAGHVAVETTDADSRLDSGFWLFDAHGATVSAPLTSQPVTEAAASLGARGVPTTVTVGNDTLTASPAFVSGRRVGTIVVGVGLEPFHSSRNTALGAALVLDVVVFAGTLVLTRRTVHFALQPVATMTASAREWSEHDPDHRFALGPVVDEITGLAATLDSLLGRLSASVRHERNVTSEIAHELKTPLARIQSTAEVASAYGRGPELAQALTEVSLEAARLGATIDVLLRSSAAHSRAGHTCDITAALTEAAQEALAAMPEITLHGPDSGPIWVDCERDVVLRALAPLLANAVSHCTRAVTLTVHAHEGEAYVDICDDGPGFASADLDRVFLPGFRGQSARGDGHGLGLALATRLADAVGGRLSAHAGPGGRITLRLPALVNNTV